jgi:nucleoid-associated protein YgaU
MNQTDLKNFIKQLRGPETIATFIFGFVVVLILSVVAFRWLNNRPTPPETPVASVEPQAPRSDEYIVQPGDSTWKVAAKFYGDGNKYTLIEKANNLKPNQPLAVGQKLIIPVLDEPVPPTPPTAPTAPTPPVAPEAPVVSATPAAQPTTRPTSKPGDAPAPTETARTYTVKAGDSLWKIAEREQGNPYRWTELYQANTKVIGRNPDLIYPGQELTLPAQDNAATGTK